MDKKLAKDILLDFKDIMDDMGLLFWLREGTLLGAVREGDFIKWDTDLDVSMLATDWSKDLLNRLIDKFWVGFCTYRKPISGIDISRGNIRMNIMLQFYNNIRDSYITWSPPYSDTYRTEIPAWMLDSYMDKPFLGTTFRTPWDEIAVLESIYGPDWSTPMPYPKMEEKPYMKWRKHWKIYYDGMPEHLANGTENPLLLKTT